MTTRILRSEKVGLESLLGDRDPATQRAELHIVGGAGAVRVEAEFGVGEIAPLGRAERRPFPLRFLVAAVEEDDVAVGLEPFGDELHGSQSGRDIAVLHVEGTATVEIATFLAKYERVELPVGALGFDDIHVPQHENRLLGRMGRTPTDDQRFGLVAGKPLIRHEVHVGVGNARRAELIGEKLRHARHFPAIVDAWDLNRLFEQLARLRLPTCGKLRRHRSWVDSGQTGARTQRKSERDERAHQITCPCEIGEIPTSGPANVKVSARAPHRRRIAARRSPDRTRR